MFVGTPPFGYEGTDEHESKNSSSWHPPRTPPKDMVYREHICAHDGPCPDKYATSRSLEGTSSPEADVPDMKLVDVVPALFSSPTLDPQTIEHSECFPDFSRLSVHGSRHSPGSRNNDMNTLEGRQEQMVDNLGSYLSVTIADTRDAGDRFSKGVEFLRLLPELMSDDEHDGGGLAESPTSSDGGESPHMHDFLRCPECDHVLKWVFVEHTTAKGEHHVHRCQARCKCESAGEPAAAGTLKEDSGERDQVCRG